MKGAKTSEMPATALLVDDDFLSLELIAALLESEGHQVWKARSGAHAISILNAAMREARPPEVVLVDMQMPGMSGSELGAHIMAMTPPRPRVIGMSATALKKGATAPFDEFLLKPLDPASLHRAVRTRSIPRQPGSSHPQYNVRQQNSDVPQRNTGVLDERVVAKLRALMPPDALREIYTIYVTDTRVRIAELEGCARRGDTEGIRRCAHMIKGSAAMAGVSGIVGIASAFETGSVPEKNHTRLFHDLRLACDDVEQSIARPAPERSV